MQGLILEGTTEDSVRLSDDISFASTDLQPRQVRVEIKAAGVCGSDLSCVHGKYYMPTPLVPGHEAAGVVVEVGTAVTYCAVGDHVILSTFSNCGHCPDCEGGNPGNCSNSPLGGLSQPYAEGDQPLYNFAGIGAFVQETIVSENQCIPIPKEMPLTAAALIGCGVITGTGAVFNRAHLQIGDTCVVIGAGGVGLNVIQAAKLCGASQIIAVDRVPEKGVFATEFGATDFILAEEGVDVIAEVKKMTGGGVHHAFEVVGSTQLLADCLQMTRPGGNICAVGVPDLTATVTYGFQQLHQNKNLMGIRAGGARPRKDFPMLADLYMKGKLKLDELISNTAGLDGLQGAFDAIKEGKEARTVLLPNG
ncbi:MAG: alcohol dehydrogenase catalytic domain-containing protein [Acidimicrobiales bacterium]